MSQKSLFLSGEGDQWYQRNQTALGAAIANDPVLRVLEFTGIRPQRVLEIGCADGWRLAEIAHRYDSAGYGVDPSAQAVAHGQQCHPEIQLQVGTADALPNIAPVDLIIFGFCLYLCDPQDLFKIAQESDRLLADQGHMLIYDFHPPIGHYRNHYSHNSAVYSYKMDYSALFSWHPAYCRIFQQLFHHQSKQSDTFSPDDMVSVQLLRKENILLAAERLR